MIHDPENFFASARVITHVRVTRRGSCIKYAISGRIPFRRCARRYAENFSRSAKIRGSGEKMGRLNSFPIRIYVPCTRRSVVEKPPPPPPPPREWLLAPSLYDRSPACLVCSSGPPWSTSIRHPRRFFPPYRREERLSRAWKDEAFSRRETEVEIKASDRVNPSMNARPLTPLPFVFMWKLVGYPWHPAQKLLLVK